MYGARRQPAGASRVGGGRAATGSSPSSPTMKFLVTGAAGFLASHLAERLLVDSHEVVGVDALLDNYAVAEKRRNLQVLESHDQFTGHRLDLARAQLPGKGYDAVFHFAGLPGVRSS